MLGLAWCEFTWTLSRLFERLDVPVRRIDLDTPALQAGDLGNRVRAAMRARIGQATVPQVFVAGEHIGGCSETLQAYTEGRLAQQMAQAGLVTAQWPVLDAGSLLPRWRQPAGSAA